MLAVVRGSVDEYTQRRQELWQAVIMQAIKDLSYECLDLDKKYGAKVTHKIRTQAEQFLSAGSEDFIEACYMAGLQPERVLRMVDKYGKEKTA